MPSAPRYSIEGGVSAGLGIPLDSGVQKHARLRAVRPRVMARIDVHDVAWCHRELGAVIEPNGHLPGQTDSGVVGLAGLGAGDRLDVVGPAPPRLEHAASESELTEGDDVHVAVCLERT